MNRVMAFFAEVNTELKKVNWPSREETIKMTTIVIIATVIVGVYVGSIDYALTKLLERFIAS